jgi:hypothetical protein
MASLSHYTRTKTALRITCAWTLAIAMAFSTSTVIAQEPGEEDTATDNEAVDSGEAIVKEKEDVPEDALSGSLDDSVGSIEARRVAIADEEGDLPEDAVSGALDDSTGSIEVDRETASDLRKQGWQIAGDMRIGIVRSERDELDGSTDTDSALRSRFRIGGTININDWLLASARIASTCTSDRCNPDLTLDTSLDTRTSVDEGDITFDQLYLHIFRRKQFDVAFGRLQTKFVARAGVFAKSLDRNNSSGFNVNWTDGAHATYHFENESIIHFIPEYNDSDGPSSVRRGPLDFSSSDARVSYFSAWESQKRVGPITQRGFDVTYLPSALLKEGTTAGPIEDYVGIVARMATARPFGSGGARWNIAAEIGYAPTTPTLAALGLTGEGDADGMAFTFAASLMDLRPNHSIGVNYGRADAGWLLSPQYRDNEELVEIRYLWRKSRMLALDFRVRGRRDLVPLISESQKRSEIDFFARFTMGFTR